MLFRLGSVGRAPLTKLASVPGGLLGRPTAHSTSSIHSRIALYPPLSPLAFRRNYCIEVETKNAPDRERRAATDTYLRQKEKRRLRRIDRKAGKTIKLPQYISAKQLSARLGVRTVDIIKILIKLEIAPNSSDEMLLPEVVDMVLLEYKRIPDRTEEDKDLYPTPPPSPDDNYPPRPPIITILGHVNHGKTTLLDTLRKSKQKIVNQEAGGITQHVGAFSIKFGKADLTFLDTPGHAAFEGIRQRGANQADIAILVIDVTRGVQPQTLTSIEYLKESQIPFVVALNKSDLKGAKPKKTKRELEEAGIEIEENGGEVPVVPISALKNKGIDDLKEIILTQAGILNLQAKQDCYAEVDIVESHVDHHRGPLATGIVRCGILKKKDQFLSGYHIGTVRWIFDSNGKMIKEGKPGQAVQFNGFSKPEHLPDPGETVLVNPDTTLLRRTAAYREIRDQEHERNDTILTTLDEEMDELDQEQQDRLYAIENALDEEEYVAQQKEERQKESVRPVSVIVRGDAAGSVEAVERWLEALPKDRLNVRVISSEVGMITAGDIQMATQRATKPIFVGLGIKLMPDVKAEAAKHDIRAISFPIIYSLMKWVLNYLTSLLPPVLEYDVVGVAELLQVFNMKRGGRKMAIAGSRITSGKIIRGNYVRIYRKVEPEENQEIDSFEEEEVEWKQVFMGKIRQLKHHKADMESMSSGNECGIYFSDDFSHLQEGDRIECLQSREVKQYFTEE